MRNKIELLAPAGGIKQFFAAVENGADAVYLGGYKFNARMKAQNFTFDELTEVTRYAHLRNVKIYITVNTLLSDEELPEATKYCTELYNIGVDGLIVQDLGLAGWVNEYLPDFVLHLSTQGTVYNLSGVKAAEALGFSRVVLARETSLKEIRDITDSSNMEIEMFVHGALCMCYSGQCQMSRVVGGVNGRSGNRGLCAQPCRLPYSDKDKEEKYPLSPRDLCTIDNLGEILDAGVTSLKIEGRIKSPEYVAIVTRIYRKYLDEYINTGTYDVLKKDIDDLRQIYSRGHSTTGYLFGNPAQKLLTESLPKHQGIYIGKIVNVIRGKKLIDIEVTEPLSLGDGIEIRNKTLTGNIVTYLEKLNDKIYRTGDIKGPAEVGQQVYRITQAALMKKARKTYDDADFADGKSHKRIAIDLELNLKINEHPVLTVFEGDDKFTFTDNSILVESAINKPLEESLAERQLRKTGSTCFNVNNVRIELEEGCILPLSSLNKLRREALNAYSEQKTVVVSKANPPEYMLPERSTGGKQLAFYLFDVDRIKTFDFKSLMDMLSVEKAKIYLPLQDFMKKPAIPEYLDPIPYILNISKGNLDKYIEEKFEQIVENVRDTGIAAGNLGWCRKFIAKGITVYADYGLNLNNENAKATVQDIGISPVYMSLESQNEDTWPIMITEHPLPYKKLTDRKNEDYHVIKAPAGVKWLLFKTANKTNKMNLIEKWEKANGEFRIYIN